MPPVRLLLASILLVSICDGQVTPPRNRSTAQVLSAKLNRRVSDCKLGGTPFLGALIRVSNDFQLPMGVAWGDTETARKPVHLSWKGATVREVIQAITRTQPNYGFHVQDGVAHISAGIPPQQSFLAVEIQQFNVQKQPVELAYFKLRTLLLPPEHGKRQVSVAGPGDSQVTLQLDNPTVEGVLDALCLASNRKIWIVTFSADQRLTTQGLRRSMSIWTDQPTEPDTPHWDVMKWGDPPPPWLRLKK